MNVWTEHRNPEGRTYWFNTQSRESVWEKPDDLKTPFERALNQTKWKEYFSGGRKYYYNTDSKESKWDMPDELLLLLEKVEKDSKAQPAPGANLLPAPGFAQGQGLPVPMQGALVPIGGTDSSSSAPGSQPPQAQALNGTNGAVGPHTGGLPFQPASVLPARPNLPEDPVIPHNGFTTVEEGEKAFMHLLRKAGVDAGWSWDQTMRAIITDPLYKALNTLAEKKAAWQKYTDALKAKEQEERDARLSKLRPAIRNMLKGNPLVYHYTTFPTADKLFAQHPIWQQAKIESERKLIFEEYVADLKQREVTEARAARSRSISKVVALFKELDVDVLTRWRNALTLVTESDQWQSDAELQKLPSLDILLAFEDYSRVKEREFEEQMRRAQVEKTRKERKAREAFKALLQGLVADGQIKARSKWKNVYPTFKEDERYLNMLGNPGSNPIELFWDIVDALDQKLDAKMSIAEGAIARHNAKLSASQGSPMDEDGKSGDGEVTVKGFAVSPETKREEFLAIVKADPEEAVQKLTEDELREIFNTLRDQAIKKQEDERRRTERKQRHLQDDLRYALKKLPDQIDVNMSYEDAVPLIENLPEYKALEDEGRKAAFAKFIKRQKERLRDREASEDGASTTSRRRKEPSTREHRDEPERDRGEREKDRDRERERDSHRDRDHESRSSKHHRRSGYDDQPRSSREHGGKDRDRDYGKDRDKDYSSKEKDRDRDYYKSSKHHRDYEYEREGKEERRKERKSSRVDWEEPAVIAATSRERSTSVYRDEAKEKRDRPEDRVFDDRAEKRARYDREPTTEAPPNGDHPMEDAVRAETPEEGEI
ncbi:hypothetical protein JAAARDRAFT_172033 [Jaapia argillacea MUCL 33604]|uniref:Uncharacterized protein n=1 Tax=Jaapia argillacea MUCL 33604 TaxID=933084 RepID=A0A067QDT7_9AGAM|nr:hypothetical protein JAAARDRAFT_172033 [Jaapia argillacea MUCL 33604]